MSAIQVAGLSKHYGDDTALAGIDFEVHTGEIVAVLGPNGAGKTTLLEILEGHRQRDSGSVSVLGSDPATPTAPWRARLGIVLQEQGVVAGLTVRETIELYGGYYSRRPPVEDLLARVDLSDQSHKKVEALSGGDQRRLDLALGLVGDPELLFLDEPTTGFDPEARRNAWKSIASLREVGTTVVLTTHNLDEAAALADRIVILRHGQVVANASPTELARTTNRSVIRFTVPPGIEPPPLPPHITPDATGTIVITTAKPTRPLLSLSRWARRHCCDLEDLTITRPSLEDVYLDLIA